MNRTYAFAAALVLATLSGAQTRFSQAIIGATNGDFSLYPIDFSASNTGAFVETSVIRSFNGLNEAGEEATMTLDAYSSGQGDYGRMRTYAKGSLTGAYRNESNPLYYDGENVNENGSPENFGTLGFAGFTDILTYGGSAMSGYKASYTFFIEGTATGSSLSVYVGAKIGDNDFEYLNADLSNRGQIAQYVTTQKYAIDGARRQAINVVSSSQFNPNTFGESGFLSGEADFDSTATLSGVQLYDENDNPVGGFTLTSASGTGYPIAPVPEPASIGALGLGAIGLLRRRRKA